MGAGLLKGVDLVSETLRELEVLYLNGLRFLLLQLSKFLLRFRIH